MHILCGHYKVTGDTFKSCQTLESINIGAVAVGKEIVSSMDIYNPTNHPLVFKSIRKTSTDFAVSIVLKKKSLGSGGDDFLPAVDQQKSQAPFELDIQDSEAFGSLTLGHAEIATLQIHLLSGTLGKAEAIVEI
jgi:hypothetical protein